MKKHGLDNQNIFFVRNKTTRYCPSCLNDKPIKDFYKRRGQSGSSTYCKSCTQDRVNDRHKTLKQQYVEYKGGKCQICGYNAFISALEFHHKEPEHKDFTISQKSQDFEIVKKELDKCDLLCCRCHREIHEIANQ